MINEELDGKLRDDYPTDHPHDVSLEEELVEPIAPKPLAAFLQSDSASWGIVGRVVKAQWLENITLRKEADHLAAESSRIPLKAHMVTLMRFKLHGDLVVRAVRRHEDPRIFFLLEARPVRIDERDRLISQYLKYEDISGHLEIVRDIAVALSKNAKGEREQVPPWVMFLMRVAEYSMFAGPLRDARCCVCIQVVAARPEMVDTVGPDSVLPIDEMVSIPDLVQVS